MVKVTMDRQQGGLETCCSGVFECSRQNRIAAPGNRVERPSRRLCQNLMMETDEPIASIRRRTQHQLMVMQALNGLEKVMAVQSR